VLLLLLLLLLCAVCRKLCRAAHKSKTIGYSRCDYARIAEMNAVQAQHTSCNDIEDLVTRY
jgi:hypothetical protein